MATAAFGTVKNSGSVFMVIIVTPFWLVVKQSGDAGYHPGIPQRKEVKRSYSYPVLVSHLVTGVLQVSRCHTLPTAVVSLVLEVEPPRVGMGILPLVAPAVAVFPFMEVAFVTVHLSPSDTWP